MNIQKSLITIFHDKKLSGIIQLPIEKVEPGILFVYNSSIYYNTQQNLNLQSFSLESYRKETHSLLVPTSDIQIYFNNKLYVHKNLGLHAVDPYKITSYNINMVLQNIFTCHHKFFTIDDQDNCYLLELQKQPQKIPIVGKSIIIKATCQLSNDFIDSTVIHDGSNLYIPKYDGKRIQFIKIYSLNLRNPKLCCFQHFLLATNKSSLIVIDLLRGASAKITLPQGIYGTAFVQYNEFLCGQNILLSQFWLIQQYYKRQGTIYPSVPNIFTQNQGVLILNEKASKIYLLNNREQLVLQDKLKQSTPVMQNINIVDLDEEDENFIQPRSSFVDKYVFTPKGNFYQVNDEMKLVHIQGAIQPSKRQNAAMYKIGNYILLHGGITDDGQVLSDFYVFNINKQKWYQINTLEFPALHSHGMFATKSAIYLLFGCSGLHPKPQGAIYRIKILKTDNNIDFINISESTQFGDTPLPRYGFQCFIHRGLLFIVGGSYGIGSLTCKELCYYDFKLKQWQIQEGIVSFGVYQQFIFMKGFLWSTKQKININELLFSQENQQNQEELDNCQYNDDISETSSQFSKVSGRTRALTVAKHRTSDQSVTIQLDLYQRLIMALPMLMCNGLQQPSSATLQGQFAMIYLHDNGEESLAVACARMSVQQKINAFNVTGSIIRSLQCFKIPIPVCLQQNLYFMKKGLQLRLYGDLTTDYQECIQQLYLFLFKCEPQETRIPYKLFWDQDVLKSINDYRIINSIGEIYDIYNMYTIVSVLNLKTKRIDNLNTVFYNENMDLFTLDYKQLVRLLKLLSVNLCQIDINKRINPFIYYNFCTSNQQRSIVDEIVIRQQKKEQNVKDITEYFKKCFKNKVIQKQKEEETMNKMFDKEESYNFKTNNKEELQIDNYQPLDELCQLFNINNFIDYDNFFKIKNREDRTFLLDHLAMLPIFIKVMMLRNSPDNTIELIRGEQSLIQDKQLIIGKSASQFVHYIANYVVQLVK